MNIQLHENGWTVIVKDFDLKNLTHSDAVILTKYLLTNTTVVFKNQKLTPSDEVKICKIFGNVENYINNNNNGILNDNFILDNSNGYISRVTGELNEQGLPGLFGDEDELEWHCNRVSEPTRKPFIWLYSERGSKGSRTSYLNNILSYNDLSEQQKEEFKKIKLNVGNVVQFTDYLWREGTIPPIIENYKPNLVHTNELGITGLFFSWKQIHFIDGMENKAGREFIENLQQFVEQEKYMYHHDWDDGDVVIAEQNLSIHKRWKFKHIEKRVLHRIAFDYKNIDILK